MKWFRARIKLGSRLALFALLIQLVLTSGHMHLDAVHAAPAGVVTASIAMPNTGSTPAHSHSPADPCAICAVMAMASSALFTATPPLLMLPQAAELLQRITEAEFDHLDAISGAPQPRGPPTS